MRWIASGVVLVAVLATAGSALAAYPGANGRIAFSRADGYIYSVKPGGIGLRKLGLGATPAYSPSGKRIAFQLNGEIWTMNADGANRQRMTRLASYEGDPTWSPDSTKLAFASDRNGGGIFTLRSTAPYGILRRVEATPAATDAEVWFDSSPAWATNGLIYYTRFDGFWEGFCQDWTFTMSVDALTRAVGDLGSFDFQEDGVDPAPRSHAFVFHKRWTDGVCNFADNISIANIDGTHVRAVTPLRLNGATSDTDPVFSPDATKVAFQRGSYVYTINANGTGLRPLAIGSAPSWQPLPTG